MLKCEITYFILSQNSMRETIWGQLKIREGEETEGWQKFTPQPWQWGKFLKENRNQSGIMEWFGLDGILKFISFQPLPCRYLISFSRRSSLGSADFKDHF